MCSGLTLKTQDDKHLFGRNMDLSYEFGQQVVVVQRKYTLNLKANNDKIENKYAIITMATVIDNYPLIADGCNEAGLGVAGLNFPHYASFEKEPVDDKFNLTPYELPLWLLGNFETVDEVKSELENIELVDIPFNDKVGVSTLHWFISDKTGKSLVVEKTCEKLNVYDNPVGILTNSPGFDWHMINLNEYIGLKPEQPEDVKWSNADLHTIGIGAGTKGMPGGAGGVDRFIRLAYIRANTKEPENTELGISQFFHMLDYVAAPKGSVIEQENEDYTLYSSCMDLEEGIYYYKSYKSYGINAVNMHNVDLNSNELYEFGYNKNLNVNKVN